MVCIRWKSGLVLLIFLLSVPIFTSMYGLHETIFSLDYFRAQQLNPDNLFYFPLFFIIPFIITVYLTSLSLTEMKIENNEYTNKWLIHYNVILFLILYFFGIIISIILDATSGSDMAGLGTMIFVFYGFLVLFCLYQFFLLSHVLFFLN